MSDWEQSTELCVSCPECAFTFDSAHADQGGGYSCPLCAELALRAALQIIAAKRANHFRTKWSYRDGIQKIAHRALTRTLA